MYATFSTDPKVIGLSDRAFRRYVEAMCYTTLHETDGWALWPQDKASAELRAAGLLTDMGFINSWTKRQRTKADVDAKRIAGRNAATKRWGNGSPNAGPNTEVELEVDVETAKQEPAARSSSNPHQPLERQLYFGERLDVTIPAIVKLNKAHGREFVLSAMEQLHGFPPEEPIVNTFAWLSSVAAFKKAGVA